MGASKTTKGLEGSHRSAAPVEPERELLKGGLQVPALDPVVRTAQPRLEVPEHLMDAGEDDLGVFWPALCLGPVSVAHAGQGCIVPPAVCDHDRAWENVTSHETGQRSSGGLGHRKEGILWLRILGACYLPQALGLGLVRPYLRKNRFMREKP